MLDGVDATPRTVEIDGTATALVELGDGPPLLLLHGGIECGGAMWAPVLTQLARRYRIVVPDVPGLGESAPLPRLDAETFANWLAGVIDRTNLGRPTLVAHSLIGSLTARVAARGEDRIDRLVIYPWRLRYVAIRFAIRPTPANAERFDRFALLDLDATRRRDPDWFQAFESYNLARSRQRHVKKTMNRLVSTQTKPLSDDEIARITIPTALLWGRHDRMVPLAIGQSASTRRGWPLHVVEDAAHAPHIEQPAAFVERLTAIAAST
jgi:pimeloyl-ACP methyl ester carboxylesterase